MLLFNDEDKRELLEEVSIYNVCDFLGIEYQNTGCRKSILCPDHLNHNDQHYGSCFIYENTNTAHCFVCNKSFDTIDLLRLNGYGYYDALCQLANLSGSLSRFEKQPDKKQFWLPNLTKEERELIGLYPTKRIKLYYAIQENKPDDRKYDIIFGKEGEDDSFLLYKTLKYNPWFMLQEKNPEGYLSMVLHSSSSMQKEALVKEKIQEDVKTLNRKGLDSKENKRFQESIGEKRETTSDILGMHSKNREARDYLKSDDMDMSVRKSQQRKIDRIVERDMGNIRDAAKVITVYSAKGGVGKTTLSCELATYLALTSNGRNRYKVCIADFNIDFGDVKNTLNFDPNKACMSVWAEDIRERVNAGQRPETICYSEAEISKYLQVDKSSNLYALLAPFTNEDSMDINTYELEVIMRNLRENGGFDFIVCDTGNNTRDSSFIALENADIIIMVLTQCMNTALCNYGLLNTLYQLNSFDLNRIKLVINKEQSSRAVGISVEELVEADAFRNPETKKPYELLGTIKNSNKVKLAGNMGSPLVYDVASEFTKEIGVIASKIIGKSYVLPEMKKKGFFARLFGRK